MPNTLSKRAEERFNELFSPKGRPVTGWTNDIKNVDAYQEICLKQWAADEISRAREEVIQEFKKVVSPDDYEWDGGEEVWKKHLLTQPEEEK